MSTIRRLYLYGVSAVALVLLAVGAASLLQLAFERVLRAATDRAIIGGEIDRELLALSVALLLVGLPLWLIHWWLAERSVRRDTPDAEPERRSVMRAVYLAGVATVSLIFLTTQGTTLVSTLLGEPIGSEAWSIPVADSLARVLVLLAVIAFHLRARHLDVVTGPITGAAAWVSRLYLYGAILGGAFVGLWGVSDAIQDLGNAVLGLSVVAFGTGFRWGIANAIALVAVGGLVWATHAWYAHRLPAAGDWRGEAERTSMVRAAHGVIATGVATVLVIFAAATTLGWLIAEPLGVAETTGTAEAIQQTIGPLVAMLPFLVGGWLFARGTLREAEAFRGPDARIAARRSVRLTVAAVGLAIGSVGLGRALGVTLEAAFGPTALATTAYKDEVASLVPFGIVGLGTWLVAWALVLRDGARDRLAEARSMVRRVYLFLVFGSSVTAAGLALAVLIYQGLRLALDIASVGAWELSQPLVIVAMGTIGLVYHGLVLRGDAAVRAAVEAPVPELAPIAETVSTATEHAVEELLIEAPVGADFEPVNQVLREHLPLGWSMRVVHHGAGAGGGAGR
jgi:hypothetical protein